MGKLLDKNDCSGCMACYNTCPAKCISVEQDSAGFYVPRIDRSQCTDCGMCEKACKKANGKGSNRPMLGKAFTIENVAQLNKSSSGGAFTAIASIILSKGGVVYGAAYDDTFDVKHIRVDSLESLSKLNGSKYVQSDLNNCFELVKQDLKEGTPVLFSGTPCQVAGLTAYLRGRHKENLVTVDIICHGVPAPKAWGAYLKHLQETELGKIQSVNMRDHRLGHENYGMCISGEKKDYFESVANDPYLMAFNRNLILREACYRCKHKKISCHSDITLADLWGGKELLPKEKYTGRHSLVMANSPKGKSYIKMMSEYGNLDSISLEKSLAVNAARFHPSHKPTGYDIEKVISQLENGTFKACFDPTAYSESLLNRVKRKIVVLGKCLVLNRQTRNLDPGLGGTENEGNDSMSMCNQ